jgi:hypothetical protein
VIVLEPHALKRRVLFNICPTPSERIWVCSLNSLSDQVVDYWNATKAAEKSIALLYPSSRLSSGHSRLWSHFFCYRWR